MEDNSNAKIANKSVVKKILIPELRLDASPWNSFLTNCMYLCALKTNEPWENEICWCCIKELHIKKSLERMGNETN